ncbi:uncharacterized protein LOC142327710 [Lycorma delicatula]|uniref:uncharacterized protein LOC142327710 n=1 Tax=Lycorma delicatula TaxID=130591 RepID=UPI003F5149C5
MTEKWNEEITMRFLKKYRKKPCLWNVHFPQYRNQQMRNAAYQELVDEMQLPEFTIHRAKNKIKNLRSTYTQELKKMEQSKGSYVTSLVWFDEINSFLRPLIGVRTSNQDSNSVPDDVNANEMSTYHLWNNTMTMNTTTKTTTAQHIQQAQTVCLPEPLFVTVQTHDEIVEVDPMVNTSDQGMEEPTWQIENIRSERRPSIDEDDDEKMPKLPKLRRICNGTVEDDVLSNNNNNNSNYNVHIEDEFDAFGRSVALQLKKMSLHCALNTQIKIQTILTEMRLAEVDNNSEISNSETTSH